MNNQQIPSGIIAAIPTPFAADGSVNVTAFLDFAETLLASGCDGLNVMGTTGEATSLSTAERVGLMKEIAASGLPMKRLIVGTGASAVTDAISLTQNAAALGFAGALLLPPFYYKNISDAGVLRYVGQVVEATADSNIPVALYNFPAMSSVAYHVGILKELINRHGTRIAGLKDSSSDLDYCTAANELSAGFKVFPSDEAALLIGKKSGLAGCISATVNLNSQICATAIESDDETLLDSAVEIRKVFEGLPLVAGVKYCVSLLTGDEGWRRMRAPLVELEAEQQKCLLVKLRSTSFEAA